jgi:hypothetical protein
MGSDEIKDSSVFVSQIINKNNACINFITSNYMLSEILYKFNFKGFIKTNEG